MTNDEILKRQKELLMLVEELKEKKKKAGT
ncbi:hypothetical protein CLMAG_60400 [Clostridium magnum DSM 2767]|uniref:Uncharacterized protein n=1 Tax=Clostridium magnum DSM 2767 TaxID=1121326 RepID=A0A162QNG1_9CLOT|nr:hypothetical protein CLMAG_59500 [Clostridium magnum DSM 2767]KZL88751.1 hypothetical protein CLMAG_60400 [Clostridium magnum DSM 2767]